MAAQRRLYRNLILGVVGLVLAACGRQDTEVTSPPATDVDPSVTVTLPVPDNFQPVSFDDMNGWVNADLVPALSAFVRTCERILSKGDTAPFSQFGTYGGTVGHWRPACADAVDALRAGQARAYFEYFFTPFEVEPSDGINRLTGYFEPVLKAFTEPRPGYETPIPGIPDDLIEIQLGDFDDSLTGRKIWVAVEDGKVVRYPAREDISIPASAALGYGNAADIFFLQIQGSGQVEFEDGRRIRAAFAAHNHRPFGSLANHLMQTGAISRGEASMAGIHAWMTRAGPSAARAAMNVNPRFVFFRALPVDPDIPGPEGGAGIPLTPLGSIAIDRALHPYGVPVFVDSRAPAEAGERVSAFRTLLIAQDTGGAIRGWVRGDVFFGSGDSAGRRAGATNAPTRFHVLLPKVQPGTTDVRP